MDIPTTQVSGPSVLTGRLSAGLLVFLVGVAAQGQEAPARPKVQEPSAEVMAAWTKADGRYGGMKPNPVGYLTFFPRRNTLADEWPAFLFFNDPGRPLAELPAIEEPIGLHLSDRWLTDSALKDLAGLQQLRDLDLMSTQVTDACLNELTGLTQLRTLNLMQTQVADAGVRELTRALPRVQGLR